MLKKLLIYTPFTIALVNFLGCSKKCDDKIDTCYEKVPSQNGVICQAFWTSWIYNEDNNKCEQVGYSGCGPVGFETEDECKQCECHK